MAASVCVDTFVVRLIADLDCHLMFIDPGDARLSTFQTTYFLPEGEPADERMFTISPGNELQLAFSFEYYVGIGVDTSHANFGFSATDLNAALNDGNGGDGATLTGNMSISAPSFNPPVPVTTGRPNELQIGILAYSASARATITYGDASGSDAGANNQNLSGTLTLNTGV